MPIFYDIPGTFSSDLLDTGTDMGPFSVGGVLYFPAVTAWNGVAGLQSASADPIGLPSKFGMLKSVDGGVNWASVGIDVSMVSFDIVNFVGQVTEQKYFYGILDVPNNQFIAIYYSTAVNLTEATLNIAFFSFGTETWTYAVTTGPTFSFNGNTWDNYAHHLIAALDGFGNVVMAYTVEPTNAGFGLWRTRYVVGGGVWDAPTDLLTIPGFSDCVLYAACPGTGLRTHAVIRNTLFGDTHFYHYLLSDAAGNPGVAITQIPSPNTQTVFYLLNPLVNRNGELTLLSTEGTFLFTAPEAAAPVWTETATPFAVSQAFGLANDVSNNTVVATHLNAAFTEMEISVWNGVIWAAPVVTNPAPAPYFVRTQIGSVLQAYVTIVVPDGLGPFAFAGAGGGGGLVITGGSVFGGPSVPAGGTISLVGAPTGVGGGVGLIPGGSAVWPPIWRAENEYDKCLNRFHLRARNVCLQAESRCIVWHDMDELGRMPDGGVKFYERGSIITPIALPVPTTIMQFVAPTGYLGIVYGITLHYTGTGFVEGSGDIVWRVMIGNAWAAPGLGNCLFQLGTVGQCLSLTDYLPANSNQRISVSVQVPNTSGNIQVGASRILATLQGWYYPI